MAEVMEAPLAVHSPWSAVVRKDAAPPAPPARLSPALPVDAPKAKSAQGVTLMVVDANAFIEGINMSGLPYDLCTIREVMSEVRDARARAHLDSLPVPLKFLEPSPESLSKVVEFARATGDLQSLSETDVKIIALAHTLEVQVHGASHLRTRPPLLLRSTTEQHRERDPPGWGSNVPNPEEWNEISEEDEDNPAGTESHILGLKDLHLDATEAGDSEISCADNTKAHGLGNNEKCLEQEERGHPRRFSNKSKNGRKQVKKLESLTRGKLMVSEGVDASKGEYDDNSGIEWEKAGTRSTRRKHRMKAAKTAASNVSNVDLTDAKAAASASLEDASDSVDARVPASINTEDASNVDFGEDLEECGDDNESEENQGDAETFVSQEELRLQSSHGHLDLQEHDICSASDIVNAPSVTDGTESEESWMIRPLWMSTVACMTSDFAMQNVILQMGLRLFTPNGVQVAELHRWMLKCHACGNVTPEVGRIFCPKCGNGGTLFRVSMIVGANGAVQRGSLRRISVRGTRYSLPMPKGGRGGAALNPVLREDQLPHKLLYPKSKKKTTTGLDMITSFDDVFKPKDDRSQKSASLRNAISIFSGRRNPNDQHFARKH